MPILQRLGPADLRAALVAFRDVLHAHRHAIDRLNVFPVPDADTGTNLYLTLDGVAAELERAPDQMPGVASAIARGAVMSARGISGVITAQMLRTLAERMAAVDPVDGAALARAFAAAAEAGRSAIARPVEGTILTVAREAAVAAVRSADKGGDLPEVLEAARTAAWEAVRRTPELLPVLREAGVVDGGGTGFALLLDCLLHVVDGRALPQPPDGAAPGAEVRPATTTTDRDDGAGFGSPRFEVVLRLRAPAEGAAALREAWDGLGDAVVVAGGDGEWTCHVHTDRPERAAEVAAGFGPTADVRVTDLLMQVVEASGAMPPGAGPARSAAVGIGAGAGVRRLLRSLGAGIVLGADALDPSVEQLLEAIGSAPADEVVVVANQPSTVPAAEQAAAMSSKQAAVVATDGIPQALAALRAFDPDAALEDNLASMREAAGSVRAGRVARAVREASSRRGPIREGDWLGIGPDGVTAVEPDAASAGRELLGELLSAGSELVTIVEGEGASDEVTAELVGWLQEAHPDVGVQVLRGDQPVDAYLLGVE